MALILVGIAVGVATASLWAPRAGSYQECIVYEMRGQDALTIHEVRKLCAQRFGPPNLATAAKP